MTTKLPDVTSFTPCGDKTYPTALQRGLGILTERKCIDEMRALNTQPPRPQSGTDLKVNALYTSELKTAITSSSTPVAAKPPLDTPQGIESTIVSAVAQKIDEADVTLLTPFCEWVALQAQEASKNAQDLIYLASNPFMAAARELVGKLAFILDQTSAKESLQEFNALSTPEARRDFINDKFSTHMKATKKSHDLLVRSESTIGLTNVATLAEANLVRAIASALITSTGHLNLAISDIVLKEFAGENSKFAKVLSQYKTDPALQQIFDELKAPSSKESPASAIIAAVCALPANAEIDATHAKRCLLATQLSSLPPQKEQCNFSTSIARMIVEYVPVRSARDFQEILNQSSLSARVSDEGVEVKIPLSSLADDSLDQISLHVSKNGALTNLKGQNLWDVHSVKLAAQVMNIADVKQAVLDALTRISPDKDRLTISPRNLIVELAQGDEKIAHRGIAAYSSNRANPLLRTWQLSLQVLAETRPANAMHARILHSVQGALYGLFAIKKLDEDATQFNPQAIATFTHAILEQLHKQIDVTYDADTHSLKLNDVDSPEKFQQLVLSSLTNEALEALPSLQRAQFVSRVREFVKSGKFLDAALVHFDSTNATVTNAAANWKSLRFTPWNAPLGNDPADFVRTYLGQSPTSLRQIQAQSAQDLVKQLLVVARKEKSKPDQRLVVTVSSHVFSLETAGKFAEAVRSSKSARAWMNSYVTNSSSVKASAPVPEETRELISSWVEKRLIPDLVAEQYRQALSEISAECNLETYCEEILGLVKLYQQINEANLPENYMAIARDMLTSFVIRKALPQDVKDKLAEFVVPFGDVSVAANAQAKLCMYPSPIDGKISLGLYTGQTVRPMNEESWIKNQAWKLSVATL